MHSGRYPKSRGTVQLCPVDQHPVFKIYFRPTFTFVTRVEMSGQRVLCPRFETRRNVHCWARLFIWRSNWHLANGLVRRDLSFLMAEIFISSSALVKVVPALPIHSDGTFSSPRSSNPRPSNEQHIPHNAINFVQKLQ